MILWLFSDVSHPTFARSLGHRQHLEQNSLKSVSNRVSDSQTWPLPLTVSLLGFLARCVPAVFLKGFDLCLTWVGMGGTQDFSLWNLNHVTPSFSGIGRFFFPSCQVWRSLMLYFAFSIGYVLALPVGLWLKPAFQCSEQWCAFSAETSRMGW